MSLSKKQFIKNSVWTFLELSLYPLLMIAATPIFIKKLGISQYGLWMLVSTITVGINALNIGVGDTNIRLISRYRAEENESAIKKVFNHNFSLSLFLCVVAFCVGIIFYYSDFIYFFYKGDDYAFANTILLLACCASGFKLVEIAILSVFKAFERFDLNSKLILISKNSSLILNMVLVLMNYGLITIFTVTLISNLANIFLQLFVLNRFNKKLISFPTLVFLREKLDFINYNFWYWLQSFVALLGFMADKLVVAYFTDVKTMGYYSVASMVGTQIHNFFLSFGGFLFPRVSFKLASNSSIDSLYSVTRSSVAMLGWSIIVILILFGDVIFKVWLGVDTYSNSIWFIKLYLVFEAGMLLIIVPFHFINGTHFIKLNSLFEITIRCSHFLCMLIGFYLFGINGILYGLIFSTFINIPFQYFHFHKKIVKTQNHFNFLWVILPVYFLLGLIIFDNVFFQLPLVLCLIIAVKLIYFDPARKYTKDLFSFGRLFQRT